MDYSKWKKILVILMIINLCFVLFSKITKSFGATVYTATIGNTNFDFSSEFVDSTPYFALFSYNNNNNAIVLRSTEPFTYETRRNSYGAYINYFYGFVNGSTTNTYKMKCLNSQLSTVASFVSGTSFVDLNAVAGFGENATNTSTTLTPVFSNFDIYDFVTGDLIFGSTVNNTVYPHFDNTDAELQSLNFDKIFISMGDFTNSDPLYLKVLEVTKVDEDVNNPSNNVYYYNDLTFTLTNNKNFLHEYFDSGTYYYSVPYSALKLKKDKSYYFILTSQSDKITQTQGEIVENNIYFDVCLCDTTNIVTTQDEIMNSIINNTPSDDTNNIINNNLPRPGYSDDSNIDIPGMNVDIPGDITTDGFNYIFNMIYSQINPSNNSDPAQDIVINIPFVNQELRINKDFTRNLIGSDSPVISLLSAFYYFIISYYIVHDIRKTIEKVKTGDIMTHTDTNIKADML